MSEPNRVLLGKLVADHVLEGIVLTDAAGIVVWVNPAFQRLCGYSLEELVGKRPGDVLQGEATSPESRQKIARAIADRTSVKVDVVNYSKAGSPYISEINLGPIFDDTGELTHFVAAQRDVTLERSLAQESTDFKAYRRALDLQAIVSVTDPRGKITYVNPKFSAISGYSSDELVGKTHRVVNSGTHEKDFFREMWQEIRAGKTWHNEVCNRTKAGELYWVDTTIVPVHGPGGEIMRYVSTRYEVTERKAIEEKLRQIAEVDAMTGLANRAKFTDLLEVCLQDPEDGGGLVVMLDIDHFKDLNDSLGHHFGDLLLREIGRRLTQTLASDCVVARLGGDEFAALIPSPGGRPDAEERIAEMHAALCDTMTLSETVYLPAVSMGVTRYPDDAETVQGAMINADVALYEAKRDGRNQWCFFDPQVRRRLEYRNHLKAVLLHALDNDRFDITLQPYCCVRTGAHRGFEVLARLDHDGVPVPPDSFIPLAEELGLMSRIGRILRAKAFEAHGRMIEMGLRPRELAINVAAQEFREPAFVETLQALLREHHISPGDLVIEITETALIGRSTDTVAKALHRLQRTGVQVALDDFGTGFSSLSHLKDFSVNKIKIDKSFIGDLEDDEGDRALVDGLIMLAGRLGLSVVAEGVETVAQMKYLGVAGCHYLQGFALSPPLSLEAAVRFLDPRHEPHHAAG
ncbi:putative bifunctional diguanylate cyclase/phosphodiesterase [Roseisalinus antarcticus]|uniref:Phytochrome-like protein cph2 n=1 Tax=Roseisalinus antarcticus TaxID=254357 RepID=A0A1Y5TYB3_9RHOB|nr:GGDEF domain-containing phosphodiesterase [Roseisalinus antarcticus]SLN76535.1 Phytochrome-like protein cph2 [Roseisalinus antarcticus]